MNLNKRREKWEMSNNKPTELEFRWIRKPEQKGERLFTFDGETIFNLFRDYPYKLTPEQKEVFDQENPYWRDFFKDR